MFSKQNYMTSKSQAHEELFDLIEKMLHYDVTKRITVDDAIQHPFFDALRKGNKWKTVEVFFFFII